MSHLKVEIKRPVFRTSRVNEIMYSCLLNPNSKRKRSPNTNLANDYDRTNNPPQERMFENAPLVKHLQFLIVFLFLFL